MLTWRKSSFSDGYEHSDCVEVAWKKSTFSKGGEDSDCVEAAHLHPSLLVRDSKNPDGPQLSITRWQSFLSHVQCL
jgi:hypothetical protein